MKAALVGVVVLLGATPAWAEVPALVFPLSSEALPASLQTAPTELTRALAASLGASVAEVPLEDAAGLLVCDPATTPCLESVASSMDARRIVFGTITTGERTTLEVTLTRFDPGAAPQQRTFSLVEDTVPALADELVRVAAPLFGAGDTRQELDPGSPLDPQDPLVTPEQPVAAPDGTITGTTWAILGTGTVAAAVGIGMWASARALRSDVESAPRETRADLDALLELEDKGTFRTRVGGVLTVIGGATLAYGIYRAVTERRHAPRDREEAIVTPVPIQGGAALVLTLGMP